MAISEAEWADLYTGLTETIGPSRAETLMSVVRLHEFDQLATKSDLAMLKSDIAELRADMAELRAEFKTDIASLQRTMAQWMLTLAVAVVGAIAGVAFLT